MSETVTVVPNGALVYGMQLPVQAKSVRTSEPWERDDSAGPEAIVRTAAACDAASFFYVAVCDHVAVPRAAATDGGMSTTWYDPVSTLSYLAARTTRTRLMTNVYVAAYRHPLQTAKTFATLDALSGGRVVLGVGAGHLQGEFDALGVPFADRGRLTNEAIDAIKQAWGSEYVDGLGQQPRPVQQPRPPIWIGGSGPAALRRVAERGDGWIPQGTPRKAMPEAIDAIRRRRDEARPGAPLDIGFIHEALYVGDASWELPEFTVSGPDARIVDRCNEMGAMGVNHLQLHFRARDVDELCDQIAAFGERIGPHLQGRQE